MGKMHALIASKGTLERREGPARVRQTQLRHIRPSKVGNIHFPKASTHYKFSTKSKRARNFKKKKGYKKLWADINLQAVL